LTAPFYLAAQTDNGSLVVLRTELDHLRAEAGQHQGTRGATPRLTTIKHELRSWIESQLGQVSSDSNSTDVAVPFARRLNAKLKEARLFGAADEITADNPDAGIGFLGEVNLEYQQRQAYLTVETFLGIQYCGIDESAYVYHWQDGHWKRIWETEQNVYTKKGQLPTTNGARFSQFRINGNSG